MNYTTTTAAGTHDIKPILPPVDALPIVQFEPAALRDAKIVGFETHNIAARPFNILRTKVAKKCAEKEWSVIGVTSAEPAAGKSFVALNLAAALAKVGNMPIYLVDLDMSRGSVAQAFGITPEYGMSDYLAGEGDDFAAVGWRVGDTNLGVFPTRGKTVNTAELLTGPRFLQFVEALRERSQPSLVIVDLPPAFANDDAMIVGQHLDAYLMVVHSGKTTKRQLLESRTMLEPTPLLGMVLNRYEGGFSDPYGYNNYSKAYAKYY